MTIGVIQRDTVFVFMCPVLVAFCHLLVDTLDSWSYAERHSLRLEVCPVLVVFCHLFVDTLDSLTQELLLVLTKSTGTDAAGLVWIGFKDISFLDLIVVAI